MNWIILIIAGLFEVAFAFCLGKAKGATGNEMYLWYASFLIALAISWGYWSKQLKHCQLGQLMPYGQELEPLELF